LRDALDRDRDDGDDEDLMRPSRKRKGRETVMYKVGVGDTLLGIARQFAVDIDDLARENGLEASSKLREGALLRLRVRADLLEQDTSAAGKAAGAREPKQDDKLDVQPKRAPAVGEEPQKKAKARARPG
jgi:membrane-bound lytic murein transglycosylase D